MNFPNVLMGRVPFAGVRMACAGRIFIKVTGFVLLHPGADQVAADVMALGEPMQRPAGKKP